MVVQQIRRMSPTDLQHRLANRPASPTCYLSTALDVRSSWCCWSIKVLSMEPLISLVILRVPI